MIRLGPRQRGLATALEPPRRPFAIGAADSDGRRATVRSRWTRVGGRRVHARVAEPAQPDAPAVVLVHGVGVSSRYLVPLALELAPDFRVAIPDLPGFGFSEPAGRPLTIEELADALVAWMRASGLEPAPVFANSFGCQVVADAAVRHPGAVERLVLQGPTFDPSAPGLLRQGVRWLRTGVHEPPTLNLLLARDYLACGARRPLATVRDGLADPFRDKLGDVRAPALVVRGSADRVVSQRWAEEVARRLPHGRLAVVEGPAHALNFSAPSELARVIAPFLSEAPRQGRARPRGTRPIERSMADFDSATAMARGVARFLHGGGMPLIGAVGDQLAPLLEPLIPAVNLVPRPVRERIYSRGSGIEAIPPEELHQVSGEAIGEWLAARYPQRRYQAAMIGSSSGAVAHLCAALGIPFLPQTVLIPVDQPEVHPDDARHGLEAGVEPGRRLLEANPHLQLHRMHDPNQDRLSLARMAYFRVKRRTLGAALERFLERSLLPGGTLLVSDCRLRWPVRRIGERHLFQFGALGGMAAEEFHRGSERVERYLERYGAERGRWNPPEPDAEAPEAEWGFEPALLADVERLADRRGYRVRRLAFEDPEDLSPLVADLHRWWYRRRDLPAERLLVESFVMLDPWWAVRTASVPLWLKFAVDGSADRLERYLDAAEPYDEIRLTLFSHGTEGVGVAPIERWRGLLERARGQGAFLGVDERRFPRDFASFARFHAELTELRPQHPLPRPLALSELDAFLKQAGGGYPEVRFEDVG